LIPQLLPWKRRSSANTDDRPGRNRRTLQFPLRTQVRTAILEKGFIPERTARVFDPADLSSLAEWAPEAIVAPLRTAMRLAEMHKTGVLDLPGLSVVVVLTDIDGEPLGEDHREHLWRAFGVPVFEQLRGSEGDVVARECEVHDGLHVDPAAKVAEELRMLNAAMVNEPCECGSETPRVRTYLRTKLPNALGTWNVVAPVGRQVT
jgi:hypothetical protein